MNYPSYESALEAAGLKVLAFEMFGSYQGDWLARVKRGRKLGWIAGSFGSCSYCDALEAELGYEATPEAIRAFGERYLDGFMDDAAALKYVSRNISWDLDAEDMVDFILKHSQRDLKRPEKFREAS